MCRYIVQGVFFFCFKKVRVGEINGRKGMKWKGKVRSARRSLFLVCCSLFVVFCERPSDNLGNEILVAGESMLPIGNSDCFFNMNIYIFIYFFLFYFCFLTDQLFNKLLDNNT